jgi:phage shock protein PspC (stress-responsive transcriptional regulator)
MKKTIQIHLGGVSFTVEEDAYAKLNAYLLAIKKYFSSYEGSSEIVEDIESRIAEKLFDKSKTGQVVDNADVDAIINSMGTVADFEAFKEEEDLAKEKSQEQSSFDPKSTMHDYNTKINSNSKLYRDGRRKAIGGVLSGFAHIINVDVVWLRILFIILSFGLLESGAGGFFILAYFILWVIMPERMDIEEDANLRKLYRDPENKALGGVAAGLSSYLKIDIVVIRILFVASAFLFGSGILIYILFWIVVPKATSITQKMELKGQALTIENIESSIKTQANASPRIESHISKILLAPFRILGSILGLFGVFVKPMGSLIRIMTGLFLLLFGITLGIAVILSTAAFFGLIVNSDLFSGEEFLHLFSKDLPPLAGFFGFLLLFVPAAAMCIIGLSFITGTKYGNRSFWLTTLGIWFAGLVGSAAVGSRYAMNFARHESVVEEVVLTMPKGIILLDEMDSDLNNDKIQFSARVNINTSPDGVFRLKKQFSASGKNKKTAIQNAKNLSYEFEQKDSVLYFHDIMTLPTDKKIRNQDITLNLEIPVGTKFKMTADFADDLFGNSWDYANKYGLEDDEDLAKFIFVMKENDEIECLDCPKLTKEELEASNENDNEDLAFENFDFDVDENRKGFQVSNFDKIEVGNAFQLIIEQGSKSNLEAFGSDRNLNDLKVEVINGKLEVDFKDPFKSHDGTITLKITTDKLESLDLSGATKTKILGFKNQNKLEIELSGASKLGLSADVKMLDISVSGASGVIIKGKLEDIEAELSGASTLNTKSVVLQNANINANGASNVILGKVLKNYTTNISGSSEISKE